MKALLFLALLSAAVELPSPAWRSHSVSAVQATDQESQDASGRLSALRGSLRAVATAQEVYYQHHKQYTTDLDTLKGIPGCVIQDSVSVNILHASKKGWAMEARHVADTARSCVMWYGAPGSVPPIATARDGVRGHENPGRVVCDKL